MENQTKEEIPELKKKINAMMLIQKKQTVLLEELITQIKKYY